MPELTYKKINELPAVESAQDGDYIEIQRGIAGNSMSFLTIWGWIKTKISNWTSTLQYLSDVGGKLAYRGIQVQGGAYGVDKQLQFNDGLQLAGIEGATWSKTSKLLRLDVATGVRGVNVTCTAPPYTGTTTAGVTTTTIYDTTKSFAGLTGKALAITSGAQKGECRKILSFTATSITVETAFALSPGVGVTYQVLNVTNILPENMNSVYAFFVDYDYCVFLPAVTSEFNRSDVTLYAETLAAGKFLYVISAQGNTIDKIVASNALIAPRELVCVSQHYSETVPHWDTLFTSGLEASATNCSTVSFPVTTNQTTYKELGGSIMLVDAKRFEATGATDNRLRYLSTIPRTIPVMCLVNALSTTANTQLFTIKMRQYVKATGLTNDIACAFGEITLTAAGDTQPISILGNINFNLGDEVWVEVKNDNTARNFTVLRSTLHAR